MGKPMSLNLLKAGYQLTVFDLLPEAVADLEAAGATGAENALGAVQGAELIISMLPASQHVHNLYLGQGDEGLLQHIAKDTLVVDSSTIDSETVKTLAQYATQRGIHFLDAPVSGGIVGAVAATLSFICGGSQQAFERVKPVLADMGKNIFHAGDCGSGQVAKMCNNMLLAVIMIGTSEALQLGIANGMEAATLSEIMQASTGRNWALECCNPCPGVMQQAPSSNQYKGGFMVDLMCKDLGLALGNVASNQLNTPISSLAQQLYRQHQELGSGKLDFSSIFERLQ